MQSATSFKIKAFGEEDADAASALHKACFPDPWPAEAFTTLLASGTFGFVVCYKNSLAGLIMIRAAADEAEILTFAVDPLYRRQGIGTRLLLQGFALLKVMSVKKLFLEVAENNVAGCALYEKLGFKHIAIREGYYATVTNPITALLMMADIE